MSVEGAIERLVQIAGAVPGTKQAPAVPPETASGFPFVVAYERTGETLFEGAGFGHDLVTIYLEVHLSRVMLAAAIEKAAVYRNAVLAGIMADPTLGGSVAALRGLRRTFGALGWGGVVTVGHRFEVDVKVLL